MGVVIVGLGNTGGAYEHTRHNAGRRVVETFAQLHDFPEFAYKKTVDALVSEGVLGTEKVTLVLPETMMNRSGKSVMALVKSVRAASKLVVVHDELDMPLGALKMVFGRNSGGHKGVESIMRSIKTKEFVRLRIGISGAGKKGMAKKPKGEAQVEKFVLGKFSPTEASVLQRVEKRAHEVLTLFVQSGREEAIMCANTKS